MIKRNKILVGCLALLLVLSVGYALFSETITINGTATAKGSFDLTTTAETDFYNMFNNNGENGIIKDSSLVINDDTVTINTTLGSPGSYKWFMIKVENTGTIPAKFKSVTDENGNVIDSGIENLFAGKELYNSDRTSHLYVELYPDSNSVGVGYETTEPLGPVGAMQSELEEEILEPGESTWFYIYCKWTENSTSGEELKLSWTFKLNWVQATN